VNEHWLVHFCIPALSIVERIIQVGCGKNSKVQRALFLSSRGDMLRILI
jgi:hypothetical protein